MTHVHPIMQLALRCVEAPSAGAYFCPRCRRDVQPAPDARGHDKVRSFRTGYVARYLACGHTIPVTQPPAGGA